MALLRAGLTAAVSFSLSAAPAFSKADVPSSQPGTSVDSPATDTVFALPPNCGSEDEFRSELERLAGSHASQAYPLRLSITENAGADPSATFHLVLDVRGERRELTHADCRTLFRGALVIAAASVKPPPPLPPPPEAPPPPRNETPARAPARPDSPSALHGGVSLGSGVALGVLPGAALVLELRASLEHELWGLSVAGKFLPTKHASLEGRGVDLVAAGTRVAGLLRPVRPFIASAGVDLDWLEGTGDTGVSDRRTDAAWGLAPSLELAGIPFESRHLRIELAAQGRVALLRPRFVVTGFRDVYQVPRFGGAGLVRGAFTFP